MAFHKTLGAVLTLCLLKLLIIVQVVNGVSIWEPFCDEEKVYTPYVRVFHKGRNGAILRDRGPGFIDLEGLMDIYVCTNGLVMMYYAKTTDMGNVYEQGELHWTPHHCQLYNPSSNNGQKSDFPKKCLLSILLIGHPQDYRLPALQMFTAPLYDKNYDGYVNATSLIMIGNGGECLIEKGAERARLRIRLERPDVYNDIDDRNADAGEMSPPGELETYPSMFCQLDVQRKLGQQGLITLVQPGVTYVPFIKEDKDHFRDTEFMNPSKTYKHELGSAIFPRYKASESSLYADSVDDKMQNLAFVADQVYAALLADREQHFVGCLRYPDFSEEQAEIIFNKVNSSFPNVPQYDNPELEFGNFTPDEEAPFWAESVKVRWLPENDTRFVIYNVDGIDKDSWSEDLEEAEAKVLEAQEAIDAEKADQKENPPDDSEVAKAYKEKLGDLEKDLLKEQVTASLWPYKAAYNQISLYLYELLEKLRTDWEALKNALLTDEDSAKMEVEEPYGITLDEALTIKIDEIAERKNKIARELSRTKFDRRYEPYNPMLVEEYDSLLANYTQLDTLLKIRTQQHGPLISSMETLQSRYNVYKGLLQKAYEELMNEIKYIERSNGPARPYVAGNPFDRTFADTTIEIGDAVNPEDGSPYTEDDPEYKSAKACHMFGTVKETCNAIKPDSRRASRLLENRKGKGLDWNEDDQWRQNVLDLIENIYKKVCPYINEEFPIAINRILKGYLMGDPAGTGLHHPLNGSRLEMYDNHYQEQIYNSTYEEMAPNNWTDPPSIDWFPPPKLNAKTQFWDHIIEALEHCESEAVPMQFWENEEGESPPYITYRKYFPNNMSEVHFDVADLMMQEKADQEYVFNWAIEMNWRIAATVLGACMPKYETNIPIISARFYALYSQDFLSPLRQIWMSNRDNPVLRVILGNFYGECKADLWAKVCMESSFLESGDRSYRPPRHLYVNSFTEMNYFITGPMAGSSGMLSEIGNA